MKSGTKIIFIVFFYIAILASGCNMLMKALQTGLEEGKLTQTEIIMGLKEALNTGTLSSTTILHAQNGYFKDETVKILLPEEAQVIIDNIRRIPGVGNEMVNDVILKINRSAEDAAIEAKPIFIEAIRNMTIKDGIEILQGKSSETTSFDSVAATVYLRGKTYSKLYSVFKPKVNNSLNKKLVGNISTNTAWNEMTKLYNKVAPFLQKPKVTVELPDFVTKKALNGLFLKIGQEERKIRKNPFKYAQDIIRKVFGTVHK